jgi:extradiol dioxygenase family protein
VPFHLAIHVRDLDEARTFYVDLLGSTEGRSAPTWIDVDFFGHQLSLHLGEPFPTTPTGHVDGATVPMPHFGVALQRDAWDILAERLGAEDVDWVLHPHVRFAGQPGEQATMFLRDPSGNPIEIKGFRNLDTLFDH